jgi:hypothetical protein
VQWKIGVESGKWRSSRDTFAFGRDTVRISLARNKGFRGILFPHRVEYFNDPAVWVIVD